jgi:hypothetical protein
MNFLIVAINNIDQNKLVYRKGGLNYVPHTLTSNVPKHTLHIHRSSDMCKNMRKSVQCNYLYINDIVLCTAKFSLSEFDTCSRAVKNNEKCI